MGRHLALTGLEIGDMPAGVERDGPYLALSSGEAGWTLAEWSGTEWYESSSGTPLRPQFVAELPTGENAQSLYFSREADPTAH